MMNLDHLLQKGKEMGFGELHVKLQPDVQLCAFVALHSTKRGPALGGCRFIHYASSVDAVIDAFRLAQGMSYKAAMANLNYGGGKAVLMRPDAISDRRALFLAFGRFVNDLGGRYITALDSGPELTDLDVVAEETRFVSGGTRDDSDPSPRTARGIVRSMEAALQFQLGKKSFKNLHIAIQGMGHVGHSVAEWVHREGARLTISDVNQELVQACAKKYDANVVSPEDIYEVECDLFSPCALGNVLNAKTIPLLKTPIVVGAANNQLGKPEDGELLRQRGILYAPDFVANVGGLILATIVYENKPHEKADEKIDEIYDTMLHVFEEAKKHQCSTEVIAEKVAIERLK